MLIKLLDKEVIAQIAAGEVVERPASVVKELVENSLDAGSSQVTVEIKGGGVSLIRVSDDGSGIAQAETGLIFQRHATSKVASLADLQSIATLGFRGEALASIAAAGEVEIVTCAAGEDAATSLRLENGAVVARGEEGRGRGTTVTVRNLFRNVPARLKFLKSPATESGRVAGIVTQYALAYPAVKFTFISDGKTGLQTPGRGQLIDSVIAVYGAELAGDMLAVGEKAGEWRSGPERVTVSGLVSAPSVGRANRGYLSFFVNRRWVNSKVLAWAVEEAYKGLLMTGKHPVAVLNITLPLGEVDVNIHPAKSEVRFQDEHTVFAAVQRAVRRAIIEQMPAPRIEEVAAAFAAPPRSGPVLFASPVAAPRHEVAAPQSAPPLAVYLPVLRVLGQVFGSYIVAEGPEGLYLIDQHAAHERVLFEQIDQQRKERQVESQSLLEPATFELTPEQEAGLPVRGASLAEFGFTVEPFGARSCLVRAVPAWLSGGDWGAALREMLDAAGSGGAWMERAAASIACHGAVRAGKTLGDTEMRALVRDLERVANPHTCPHGRPTMIQLGRRQLEKEFGRT